MAQDICTSSSPPPPWLPLQAYYLAAPLPCERAETSPVMSYKRKGCSVTISRTTDFPVRCFVLEVSSCQRLQQLQRPAALQCPTHLVL